MTTFSSLPSPPSIEIGSMHLLGAAELVYDNPALWIVLLIAVIVVNGVFVAINVALSRIHTGQLEEAVLEDRRGAAPALNLVKRVDVYIGACRIGITVTTLMLGALGEPLMSSFLAPLFEAVGMSELAGRGLSFALGVIILTLVHTVFAEQIPRAFGIRKTVSTVIMGSPPLRIFYLIVAAPVWLVRLVSSFILKTVFGLEPIDSSSVNHTADELRHLVEETGRAQEVTETEQEILKNALELNELCVRDILTPRSDVVVLDVHKTFKENLELALESKHTRFPLVDSHLDNTLGLIHIKDLLREMQKGSPNLFAAKRDLLRVSEVLPLDELLQLFLSQRAHIALVVDEFGGSVGLVMFDDVLDQVVGEIYDEFDDEEEASA